MSETKTKSIKSTKLTIRKRRVFSDESKCDKAAKLLAGELTMAQLCKLWQISTTASAVGNGLHLALRLLTPTHKRYYHDRVARFRSS